MSNSNKANEAKDESKKKPGRNGLKALLYSDIQNLIGFIVVVLGIIVILAALILGVLVPSASQTTQSVLQIMSGALLAVIGFYFGKSGTDKAEKRAETEAEERKAATSMVGEMQSKIANVEQTKSKMIEDQKEDEEAARLAGEALELHYRDRFSQAEEKYSEAIARAKSPTLKARTETNHAFLLLDSDRPQYDRVSGILENATGALSNLTGTDNKWWVKLASLGEAVAKSRLNKGDQASQLLNGIGDDIENFKYLFDEKNLNIEDAKHLRKLRNLSEPVIEFLDSIANQGKRSRGSS